MTNVIQFPGPAPKTTLEQEGESAIRIFAELAEVPGREHSAVLFAVSRISASRYMRDCAKTAWGGNDWTISWEGTETRHDLFAISTELRPRLFPEFGYQGHREYLRVEARTIDDIPPESEMPNSLLQDLTTYYAAFPQVIANRIQFNYAALAALIDFKPIRYISHGVENDKFVVQFLDTALKEHGQIALVTYTADFLPLLLDASAFTHYAEQRAEDES